MTRKNSHSDQEKLWSRSFEDEEFIDVPYSRSAKKKAENNVSPITKIILIFGILLLVLPSAAYLLWLDRGDQKTSAEEEQQGQIVISQNISSTSEKQESSDAASDEEVQEEIQEKGPEIAKETGKEEVEQKEPIKGNKPELESKNQTPESSSVSESPKKEETKKPEPPSKVETKPEPDTEKQETLPVTGKTYTVQPGDNLYRIALNHNLTTDQLKAMNGISGNEIKVGDVLKVQ